MISWGISGNSHDAALAVFVDNQLVFASHAERFSGKKNDRDLNNEIVAYAKQWGSPDRIYWYERPLLKTVRQFCAGQGWKGRDNDIEIYMARYGIDAPIEYVDHHLSHAAGGYYTSEFDEACVIVIDAIGEWDTATIWEAKGNKLKKRWSLRYPHSIGLFYSAMTQRVGLTPNEDEYILMGMAAYGDYKKLYDGMSQDFIDNYETLKFKRNCHRGVQDWRLDLIIKDSFEIAATTQKIYEDYFQHILIKAKQLVKSTNLVLMGGCALNCSANRLVGHYFNNTWIMPNPGDAGSAVGAVLAKNPSWRIDPKDFTPFLGYDMRSQTRNETIIDYLIENKICGVARDRAEYGPRALGNRSLLADPRGSDIKDRVNGIKQRQEFRPFAPMILEEHVEKYFKLPYGVYKSPFMQYVAVCREPKKYPAIVHTDGTSRVQTVPKNGFEGSQVRELLEIWYAKTGCPMLLNTSLNIKGQAMVNDITQSRAFERQYGVKVFN
jgi:carbamoyltransferase